MTSNYLESYSSLPLFQKMGLRGVMLCLLSAFMMHAKPIPTVEDHRLQNVISYINKNLNREITINELADVACMSKSYLIRSFCKETGTPPLQYINKKKISRAQLLLLTTNKSIKEIAYELGFNNNSYFVRLFRQMTDVTPLAYRQQNIQQ